MQYNLASQQQISICNKRTLRTTRYGMQDHEERIWSTSFQLFDHKGWQDEASGTYQVVAVLQILVRTAIREAGQDAELWWSLGPAPMHNLFASFRVNL
jgi:hypothetical protein